jgi:hypothetical protein
VKTKRKNSQKCFLKLFLLNKFTLPLLNRNTDETMSLLLSSLDGWNAQEPDRNPPETVLGVTNQSPTLYSFKGAQNLFPAWRNRFLDSLINVYKFWLSIVSVGLKSRFWTMRVRGKPAHSSACKKNLSLMVGLTNAEITEFSWLACDPLNRGKEMLCASDVNFAKLVRLKKRICSTTSNRNPRKRQ